MRARDFPEPLFRVDRKGAKKPLLLSAVDGQPKYFGTPSVRVPKRFHLVEIARDVGRRMKDFLREALKSGR